LLKNIVKTIVEIWSDSSNTEATRVSAFLVCRRLAFIGDAGLTEMTLKTAYQGLVKGSRNTTVHTLQGINLMKNSAADLWGIDQGIGYTTGFSYIRQLAIHLRGSITNKSKVGTFSFPKPIPHSYLLSSTGLLQNGLQLAVCPLLRFLVSGAFRALRQPHRSCIWQRI
jgi:hypothetical protein